MRKIYNLDENRNKIIHFCPYYFTKEIVDHEESIFLNSYYYRNTKWKMKYWSKCLSGIIHLEYMKERHANT